MTKSQVMRESAVMISSLSPVKLRLSAGCFKSSQPRDQPRDLPYSGGFAGG